MLANRKTPRMIPPHDDETPPMIHTIEPEAPEEGPEPYTVREVLLLVLLCPAAFVGAYFLTEWLRYVFASGLPL